MFQNCLEWWPPGRKRDGRWHRDSQDLLRAWRQGDQAAFERLTPLVYDELRRRARHYLRGARPNHTLRPTALVHEVYVRLVQLGPVDWQDRSHFFALAARQMRRILVERRARNIIESAAAVR